MKVRNRKIIRHLSWKSLSANRTRNIVAICAIALTALLFTSLFTIALSINEGFQQANFRQAGGYAHGSFKRMTEEQYNVLKEDPLIAEQGVSRFLGAPSEPPFNKSITEIRSADENYAKFSFATPTTGRLPEEGTDEAAMDTSVLELLGVEPELGKKITLTFDVGANSAKQTTQTFTLCGWWEKDEAMPASEVFIPNSRVDEVLAEVGGVTDNMTGTWNMDVMLESGSAHIDADMQQILADNGYQSEDVAAANYIDYGVNWGYTGANLAENFDPTTAIFIVVMLLLILFTGYLIIYNVFQISVAGDVRFYGLLKTIGTTPRQIRRMIRQQALLLSVVGIPIGLVLGWLVGKALVPVVISQLDGVSSVTSTSPWIFVGSALFALVTVFISCLRPGRMAGRVSPIEALRYTESSGRTKGKRTKKKVSIFSMAWANLGRSRGKTFITIVSLALAVVLFQLVVTFVNGFDMDRYVSRSFASDFQIADAGYFQNGELGADWSLSEDVIAAINAQGGVTSGGRTYGAGASVQSFQPENWLRQIMNPYYDENALNAMLSERARDPEGNLASMAMLYGMEDYGLDHLTVVDGDLADVYDPAKKAVAVVVPTDDYGKALPDTTSRKVGDKMWLRFVEEWEYVARETGEVYASPDDIPETVAYEERAKKYHDVEYTVAALVAMPGSLSYGYSMLESEEIVINAQNFIADSGNDDIMYYAFDTSDAATAGMEDFLSDYTENIDPALDYQSKQTYIDEFNGFRNMFALLGGTLSAIIAVIGVLNVFNAILTGITSRRRELAMLQSIGMTAKQLRRMLVIEGLLYTLGAVALAAVLVLAISPFAGEAVGGLFFWFSYRPTYWPLAVAAPVFAAVGVLIPLASVHRMQRNSVVDRLREE
ncbi:MAG: FtsX-like permease family protein [Peptococcaceae bacterium]|nr:FtsX-like permease family protein [Peptococcaceae bacterium]